MPVIYLFIYVKNLVFTYRFLTFTSYLLDRNYNFPQRFGLQAILRL
jgi:hypothetical protein